MFLRIFVALLVIFSSLLTVHSQETVLSPADLAVAAAPMLRIFEQELVSAPADITFAVADLKYDHGAFKIIECGNGPTSSPATHPLYINNSVHTIKGPYWDIVEHALQAYNIPTIFVGEPPFQNFKHFASNRHFRSFRKFTHSSLCCSLQAQLPIKRTKINEHLGIIIYRATNRREQNGSSFYNFQAQNPAFLLINKSSNRYFFSKDATYKLLEEAGLSDYIPRYAIYPARYDEQLAEKIRHDLAPADKFIIKPLDQSFAAGVGLTTTENLDAYLQYMFGTAPVAPTDETSIGHWRTKKSSHFLVSECASSQPIRYCNKTYQPTMRVIFLMTHEEGHITVNVTGGIWKLPPTHLDDEHATLTDRYITNPTRMIQDTRILIEKNDLETMKIRVAPVLAQMYKTILAKTLAK